MNLFKQAIEEFKSLSAKEVAHLILWTGRGLLLSISSLVFWYALPNAPQPILLALTEIETIFILLSLLFFYHFKKHNNSEKQALNQQIQNLKNQIHELEASSDFVQFEVKWNKDGNPICSTDGVLLQPSSHVSHIGKLECPKCHTIYPLFDEETRKYINYWDAKKRLKIPKKINL